MTLFYFVILLNLHYTILRNEMRENDTENERVLRWNLTQTDEN